MNTLKYIFILLLAACTAACSLDFDPISNYEDDKYGQNDEEINVLVMGCYAGMRKPLETEWMMTELRSDNSLQGSPGSTSTQNINLNYLDMFSVSSTHPSVYSYWYYTYQNIDNANRIIKKCDADHTIDSALSNQYRGEALFVRSYHFFNLVRLFGPVFLPTESLTALQAKEQNRVATPQVYVQIISDLKAAIEGLPKQYGQQDLGRATAWAAKGLLAKVYLTVDSVQQADALLQDIISNSSHRLLGSYADVFSTGSEVNAEMLFAIRFTTGSMGQGSSFANWFAASSSGSDIVNGGGSGYNCPTASLNQLYEFSDTRRDVNIGKYVSGSSSRLYVKKYLSYVKVRYDAENDWPVLRYSDIILMHAETQAKLQGPSAGVAALNLVRQRAGATLYGSVASINDFMDMIFHERRLEFAFENNRWFDMQRSGKAIEFITLNYNQEKQHYMSTGYSDNARARMENVQPWQLLLPIPQREIDTNNQLLIVQNFGY